MKHQQIEELAIAYWADVPTPSNYPRNLEHSVCWGHAVTVLTLADLKLSAVHSWLADRGILRDSVRRDRPLRACLAAINGQGFIFLNGTDPEDQRRFSLAHEIAHFILEYEMPRKRAIAFFGDSIIEVLDGERKPTVEERLAGSLRSVTLGNFDHLMDRDADGVARSIRVIEAEDNADRLALELLAPRKEVMLKLRRHRKNSTLQEIADVLIKSYGLPIDIALQYARVLSAKQVRQRSFRDWIGK